MTDHQNRVEVAGRALQTLTPSTDLWAEAEQRAGSEPTTDVVEIGPGRHRRPPYLRWVAMAAVAAILVGTLVAINWAREDPQGLDTGPAATGTTQTTMAIGSEPVSTEPLGDFTVYTPECDVIITGKPLGTMFLVPQDGRFYVRGMSGAIGDGQTVAIYSGQPRFYGSGRLGLDPDLEVDLESGPGRVWVDDTSALVAVTGHDRPTLRCDGTFTVMVAGGSRDANRDAAIDIANRIRTGTALAKLELSVRTWSAGAAVRIGVDPADPPPEREPLPVEGITIDFRDDAIRWSDGCNDYTTRIRWDGELTVNGDPIGDSQLLTTLGTSTEEHPCPQGVRPNETIHTLFASPEIGLELSAEPTTWPTTLFGNGVSLALVADS